jgi:hypothetical protein
LLVEVVVLLLIVIMDQAALEQVDIEPELHHFLDHLVLPLILDLVELVLSMERLLEHKEPILHLHFQQEL